MEWWRNACTEVVLIASTWKVKLEAALPLESALRGPTYASKWKISTFSIEICWNQRKFTGFERNLYRQEFLVWSELRNLFLNNSQPNRTEITEKSLSAEYTSQSQFWAAEIFQFAHKFVHWNRDFGCVIQVWVRWIRVWKLVWHSQNYVSDSNVGNPWNRPGQFTSHVYILPE